MWCSFPPPLTDDQITAVLDDVAEPIVIEHIQQCEGCASRLAQARHVEQSLARVRRFDCPPAPELANYHLGLVSGSEERKIIRHIEQCALCTTELEDLRVFLSQDELPDQPVPSAQVVTPPATAPAPRPRFGELVARLVPRAAGLSLRGAAAGPIMAEASNTTLVIDVQPITSEQVAIMGQVVAEDYEMWTGALVELRQHNQLQGTTTVDDLGSFTFAEIRAEPITLRVTPEHGPSIVLENVSLSA